jgi:hypothetical protein
MLAMEQAEWKPFRDALDKSEIERSLMICGKFLDGTFQLALILFDSTHF